MNRAAIGIASGAALLFAAAGWVLHEARAVTGARAASASSAPSPLADQPAPGTAGSLPSVMAPEAPRGTPEPADPSDPGGARRLDLPPVDVKVDEPRLASLPMHLSGPAETKVRYALDQSVKQARALIAADRPIAEVMVPVEQGRERVRELLSTAEPSAPLTVVLQAFDALEQQARARARKR